MIQIRPIGPRSKPATKPSRVLDFFWPTAAPINAKIIQIITIPISIETSLFDFFQVIGRTNTKNLIADMSAKWCKCNSAGTLFFFIRHLDSLFYIPLGARIQLPFHIIRSLSKSLASFTTKIPSSGFMALNSHISFSASLP